MKTNNKIHGISFIRKTDEVDKKPVHEITLHLESEIPALGYSTKEIIKFLKQYGKLFG